MGRADQPDDLAVTAVTTLEALDLEPLVRGNLHVIVIGNGTFATHPLMTETVTIGRSSSCDIVVADKSISRRHAMLRVGETTTIEDLGSANGTVARGERVTLGKPCAISIGEPVLLGDVSIVLQQRSEPTRARRLWTHDYFEARLEEECARPGHSVFALLRIHADRADLIEEGLAEVVRRSDIVTKYGPLVFEVMMPDTSPEQAGEAVRRIDKGLVARGLHCNVAFACSPRDGRTPAQLVAHIHAMASAGHETTDIGVVVSDPQMLGLHRLVEQVAASHIGVLLLGETGVGKEVFARAVHRDSARAKGPFVVINCAALSETLLESELFGHEKGAFTNAIAAKPGLIEMADGGTLVLDEVGDMPLPTQAKLLRVIEDGQLRRVGATKSRAVDVRFVASTNVDLEHQVERGAFRRDLFFRLNGVTIVIPPLRERQAELELLAESFIARAWTGNGRPPSLSPETRKAMAGYGWPGNVRELKHMMERAVLLCDDGTIRPEHLKLKSPGPPAGPTVPPSQPASASVDEQQRIVAALESTRGNQTVAARLLGISRRTLVNRLNEYPHLQRPRKDKKKPPNVDR